MRGLGSLLTELRAAPAPPAIPGPADVVAPDAGAIVTEGAALRTGDAYACVSLLADAVSMLPLDGYRREGEGGVRRELRTVPPLLAQPDPELERWDWVARNVTSLALRGNAYNLVVDRDRAGYPTAVQAIHPDIISPRRNRDTGRKEFVLADGQVLDAYDIIHIPLVTIAGDVKGLSPLDCARRSLRLAIQTEQFGDRWFSDGAAPSSVLESDKDMTDDQARVAQAKWVATHGGRRRPAVLSGGLKWKPVTITPNESQFLETRKLNTAAVARIWRIPPHMIGDVERSTSWGRGIEEQGIGFVVFTLGPYLTRLEAALSRQMPRQQYARFNVSALLRGNTKDRYLAYAIGRQWGWLSVDDIRALEDLPPLPNGAGQVYLQPLNMIDAEKALQALLDGNPDPGGSDAG